MNKLALPILAVVFLVVTSCTSKQNETVSLITEHDSISFATGVFMAEDLGQIAIRLGIDSTCFEDFVRGIRDGYPSGEDKKALAYSQGLHIGSRAQNMLEQAHKLLYNGDTAKRLNREHFISGVIATINDSEKINGAIAYFNRYKYKSESDKFILDNGTRSGVVSLPSGLQYKMAQLGNGEIATPFDTVRCIYKGTLPNGRTIETSYGAIIKLHAGSLIPGLSEALCMLPEGSKCKVYIPWQLGYGERGNKIVPPYSPLVFDIELIEVIRNNTKH